MRLAVVACFATAACGPGLKVPDAREAAHASMVEAANDPEAITKMLRESVTLGTLIFDDGTCASSFPPGQVRPEKFVQLAHCLAGLQLKPSTREDELGDVTVMTYGPGFEVEARVVRQGTSAQLTWLGFASQHGSPPNAAMLAPSAFEALRTSGQRVPSFDAAMATSIEAELDPDDPDDVAVLWLKICLDETGAITMIDPYSPSSYVSMEAFLAVAGTWSFRPFVHAGTPRAACSMVRMAHPSAKAPQVERLPLPPPPSTSVRPPLSLAQRKFAKLMQGKRIAGQRIIGPDAATQLEMKKFRHQKFTGFFRLCLDTEGRVESVLPMQSTGFAAYDERLMAGMQQWRYSPYTIGGAAVPVCTAITFIYSQR